LQICPAGQADDPPDTEEAEQEILQVLSAQHWKPEQQLTEEQFPPPGTQLLQTQLLPAQEPD